MPKNHKKAKVSKSTKKAAHPKKAKPEASAKKVKASKPKAVKPPKAEKKSKKAKKEKAVSGVGKISAKLAALLQQPSKPTLKPGQSILDTPEGAERLRELVKLAKEQGYLTFDDLNEQLPESVNDPDEMELV